jgi:hypothetical protein
MTSDKPPESTRQFIRHTVDVPIEVCPIDQAEPNLHPTLNVSHGGLAFTAWEEFAPGSTVAIRIPAVQPPFEAKARVAWCQSEDDHYTVGVEFLNAGDAFRSRMVQQVCEIQQYRTGMERHGQQMSRSDAAEDWIRRHADSFPRG